VIESRIEVAQKFRIETARNVDVGDRPLPAGGGDAALGQRAFARTPGTGQRSGI
jgi:hypothetical protein